MPPREIAMAWTMTLSANGQITLPKASAPSRATRSRAVAFRL